MNIAKACLVVLFIQTAIAPHVLGQSSGDTSAAGSLIGKEPAQARDDNGLGMRFVWCPPGDLTMEEI